MCLIIDDNIVHYSFIDNINIIELVNELIQRFSFQFFVSNTSCRYLQYILKREKEKISVPSKNNEIILLYHGWLLYAPEV